MNPAPVSLQQLNRTFIGSVLFIDIVGYAKHTVAEQLGLKELFAKLLISAIKNVAETERILVDTGDGAAIAFLGDPEDALFAALSFRDAITLADIPNGGGPNFVRMGINLGPLKVVRDINGHTNMIGDGVNDAQRVMSFAGAGQIVVSHSYYDIISRFSRDYAKLFVYEGTRQDKHVREHEVYSLGPIEDAEKFAETMRDRSRAKQADEQNATWQPGATGYKSVNLPTPPATAQKSFGWGKLAATLLFAGAAVGAAWWYLGTTSKADASASASTKAVANADEIHSTDKPAVKKAAAVKSSEKPKTRKCKFFKFETECSDAPTTTPQGY
ncbi:MAG: adenylate/guanylate cyclase domain-containing protein [Burkholderiales bacterium]|nr:adenylate/guanylate cyclase domain-containing protein [Burkholderiales bacterium]